MTQYVQHISGKGEKWKLVGESNSFIWKAYGQGGVVYLPTSEYQICDSPEEWEDVTKKYKILNGAESVVLGSNEKFRYIDHLHNGPAFIIERKKS